MEAMAREGVEPLDLASLKNLSITQLHAKAAELGLDTTAGLHKQELVFQILQAQSEGTGLVLSEGVVGADAGGVRLPALPAVQLPRRA